MKFIDMNTLKKLIYLSIVITMALPSMAQSNKSIPIDKVAAIVGKNIILQSDIEVQYLQLRMQGSVSGTARSLQCQILEDMMFQKLLLNQAEMDSITVSNDQVEDEIERRINMLVSRTGSKENLETYFGKTMSEIKEDLRQPVQEHLIQEQVENDISKDILVTPSEVRAFYNSIPTDSLPMVNTKYEVVEIVKRPPISIDEKLAIKEKLYQIRRRILDGESFSTMAVLYSEDPGSASKGGELGFTGKGEFAQEFETAAFGLREGEISEVVETEFGFHIIQLIEKRDNMVNCRHILMSAKVSVESLEAAQNQLDSIVNQIRKGNITFEEACKKFSDDDTRNNGGHIVNLATGANMMSIQEMQEMEPYYNEYKNLSFVINRLEDGEISDPVPMTTNDNKDAFRIVMVKNRIEAHRANINQDYDMIQSAALQLKKQNAIEKWVRARANRAYVHVDEDYKDCDFRYSWDFK